ncbi:MAG: hypothetical protein GY803_26380 [Chloroflexi bacterium]|nr:hypothetical protein [Chloroflexota bacterium]
MRQHTLVERQHPIFSPVAIISTLILAGALAVVVYLTGGRAFSPGDLSAVNHSGQPVGDFFNHAEFGGDCSYCHTPFKGIETARCETCHEAVKRERQAGEGTHGRLQKAKTCAQCHLDHRGGNFNMLAIALADFDHSFTPFSLVKHERDYDGLTLKCTGCHVSDTDFTVALASCADCHQTADHPFMTRHRQAYGDDCLPCHDGLDTMTQFTLADHEQIYPLAGVHQQTACEDCHTDGIFEGTPQECVGCHEEPAAHQGLFTTSCANCHVPDGWKPAIMDGQPFSHAVSAGFSLIKHSTNFDNAPFTCQTCHLSSEQFEHTNTQCADCHAQADVQFVTDHTALFGADCISCHDGTGEMANFDHAVVWPLEGQHAAIECAACHVDQSFAGTSGKCAACHEEPEIHAGVFGLACENCHTAVAWQPAQLTYHSFPLNHGEQGEIPCETCHTATYTQYTCYNCHEHDQGETEREHVEEGISLQELADCVSCHPTGHEDEAEEDD